MSFLTPNEIKELTNRSQRSAQIRVLNSMGLTPLIDLDGRPHVTWDMLNQSNNEPRRGAMRPNFEALKSGTTEKSR